MVKNIFKYMMCALIAFSAYSCADENIFGGSGNEGNKVMLTVGANMGTTRTVFDPTDTVALWQAGDDIGVLALYNNSTFTDAVVEQFVGNQTGTIRKTTFTGPVTDKGPGSYELYAMSPYVPNTYTNNLHFLLRPNQTPADETWDPRTDLMLGVQHNDAVDCAHGVSEIGAQTIDFTHKFGFLKLTIQGGAISKDAGKRINYVRLYAPSDMICGDFAVDLKNQSISLPDGKGYKTIVADIYDRNLTLQQIAEDGIWFTMKPGTYNDIRIAFKLVDGNYTQFARISTEGDNPLVINENSVTEALLSQKSTHTADSWSADMGCICGTMPQKAYKTDPLKILVIGNEAAEASTRYLGDLCQAEGLVNVDIYRCIAPEGSLADYKNFIQNGGKPTKIQRYAAEDYAGSGKSAWKNVNMDQKTLEDFLVENSFDVVVFQQDMEDNANYSTYQPYLAYGQEMLYCINKGRFNKETYMVWDMGTSFNSNHTVASDIDYTTMYNNIVTAAQSMKAEAGMDLILTPGTAFQKARTGAVPNADFSAAGYKLLTEDGRVPSNAHGSYLASCTWFEQLIVPIYAGAGVGTVDGNTFYPTEENSTEYHPGWHADELFQTECVKLQKIAHATAMDNPFFSTNPYWKDVTPGVDVPITSIDLHQHTVSMEIGDTYAFAPTINPSNASNKNLVWTSTNEDVATVDANGVVTALVPGITTIRATAIDGSNKFDECAVTVNNPAAPQGEFYVDIDGLYRTEASPFNVEGTGFFIDLNRSMFNLAAGDIIEIGFTHNGKDTGNNHFLEVGKHSDIETQKFDGDRLYLVTSNNNGWFFMKNSHNSSMTDPSYHTGYLNQNTSAIRISATKIEYYAYDNWTDCICAPGGDNVDQILAKYKALEYFTIGTKGVFNEAVKTSIDYIKITKPERKDVDIDDGTTTGTIINGTITTW